MYHWCKLLFDEDGNIIKRISKASCSTERELPQMLARLVINHAEYPCSTNESRVCAFEKKQNISGKEMERYGYRTVWNGETFYTDYRYFLKQYQLVEADSKTFRVLDARMWHNEILKALAYGVTEQGVRPHRRKPQGKTHKKSYGYHWHKNVRRNLQHISEGKCRVKYASKYRGSVDYDPKINQCENNWKQAKVRHQYEWHKPRHKDTIRAKEIDDNGGI